MQNNLMLHNPKFAAKLTTLDALRNLDEPQPLGPMHKPVAHHRLVDALIDEACRRGYEVARTQLATGAKGAALFGIMDLVPSPEQSMLVPTDGDRSIALGFRNSTNRTLGIQGVAGTNVFVCDNLALSGTMFAMRRKNTTGMDLGHLVACGFDKFAAHTMAFNARVDRLRAATVSEGEAKQVIYDVFASQVLPMRLFDDVDRAYFKPTALETDCHPRSLWGVHNACTRAMRDLSPTRRFGATVALGAALQLDSTPDIDVADAVVQ